MTRWTPRIRAPLLLVRGQDSYAEFEVWGPSGIQEPASGTLTVYDGDDTVIVNAQAIVPDTTTHRATITVLAASLPATLNYSAAWRASWALVLAGESCVFHQDAQLIQRQWRATVVQGDLLSASPQLRNSYDPANPDDNEALSELLEAVTQDTQGRLVNAGNRPWLIFDPWRLNSYLVQVTLARIFRGHLFDQDPANFVSLNQLATDHTREAETLWSQMSFTYDLAQSGKGDQVSSRPPARVRIGYAR